MQVTERKNWVWGWLLMSLLLAGCTGGETAVLPTLVPPADTPVLPAHATASADPAPSLAQAIDGEVAEMAVTPEPVGQNDGDPVLPPTPAGVGVRPDQAEQRFVPSLGLDVPISNEWRPPPFEVPLSLHPDDHYWLIRPIPSGRRNYDLEWYPYGNDVLLPQLPPYRVHHGLDFPNEPGTPILAASSGTVVHAGPLPSPRDGLNYYGNTVIIHHDWQWLGQDVYTLYAHTLELFVRVGSPVEQGQLIAGVGSSGEVSGPHLHFEVRVGANNYNSTRNPALWMAPFEGWGTLAGRVVDRRGRYIPGAIITVQPVNVDVPGGITIPVRRQMTYVSTAVQPDEVWQENFVVGDLPAGRYTLLIDIEDITYRRNVTIYPGQTTFEIISTTFDFVPTATPEPTPTPTSTPPAPEDEEEP
jgi:murein DD-endopeptidase MepM/ murein hydrolase activator NlpD